MPFQIDVARNRDQYETITLYEANGTTGVALDQATGDKVRFKISRRNGDTHVLDLTSAAATANGSSVSITSYTAPATISLLLARGDTTDLAPGIYQGEVIVIDVSDSSRVKHADFGVVTIMGAAAGGVS